VDTHLPRQVQHPGGSGELGSLYFQACVLAAPGGDAMSQTISSLPRPVLFAIVGAAAVLALLFATRQGKQSSSPATPAPTKAPAPAKVPASTKSGTHAQPSTEKPKSGGSSSATKPSSSAKTTLPAPVKSALDAHKVVVILFWNPRGADDRSVKGAVDSVSRHGGAVAKFTDTLGNLSRYTKLTGQDEPITQTPTVVVVDRRGKGRFSTGLQDSATVDQLVVDALK
jgi:cytoskeletal protein RodZ